MPANKTIMKAWKYHNPVEITFGKGVLSTLSELIGNQTAVLITTPGFTKRGVVHVIKEMLGPSLLDVYDGVQKYPTFVSIKEVYKFLKCVKYDVILALGGGSVIDTAKAFAANSVAGNEDWLEHQLKCNVHAPEQFFPKPIIAIPTTAGTGSEVTMWATVWDMEEKNKYSISHPLLYPQKAVVDPELTSTLPEKDTVYSALDALSHAMESIWNTNHNPVSDIYAQKAIEIVYSCLPKVKNDLNNITLRTSLMQASLLAGLAFSNTRTGIAHAISYPLTAHFGLPHGLACSLPLPHLLKINGHHAFDRVKLIADALKVDINAEELSDKINKLFIDLKVPSHLSYYGISENDLEVIVYSVMASVKLNNNIVSLKNDELMMLIESLY